MKTITFRTLAIALGVSSTALTAPYAFAQSSSDQQTIQQLRQQLNDMQARLERLESQQGESQQSKTGADITRLADNSSNDGNSVQGNSTQGGSSTTSGGADSTGVSQSAAGQEVANEQSGSGDQSLAQKNSSLLEKMQQTQIGGTFEFGQVFNDWDEEDKDTGGDLDFNKFIIAVDGEVDDFTYSLDYRFYDGYRFIQHGWLGYNVNDSNTVKVGLVQVPFGNMDYGYLGWYGNLGYLAGFNDNQNLGVKWDHDAGAWTTSLAYFKNSQLGSTNESYGANPPGGTDDAYLDDDGSLVTGDQGNKSENQLAARIAYTFGYDTDYATEINLSAKGGQLYNEITNDSGDTWQVALGLDGSYGNWRTLLQATTYAYHAKNPSEAISGVSDNVIQLGAFGFNYNIPDSGQVYTASLGYSHDVDWGPVTNLYFYNDYSYMSPDGHYPLAGRSDVDDPQLNDLGVLVSAGPYYAWFDVVTNKNGLNYFGSPVDDSWHTSLMSHFGVQF
ncbi:hypothetical protein [Phytohalomonas tamaricis]|uniref:hypothetical protein n=1 Tax=Phytohalomonas tamaricis TaxID=2081032 RepID=UPI000D0B5609|nr:hypothetical protein [Phytohalomonas tamaricis]